MKEKEAQTVIDQSLAMHADGHSPRPHTEFSMAVNMYFTQTSKSITWLQRVTRSLRVAVDEFDYRSNNTRRRDLPTAAGARVSHTIDAAGDVGAIRRPSTQARTLPTVTKTASRLAALASTCRPGPAADPSFDGKRPVSYLSQFPRRRVAHYSRSHARVRCDVASMKSSVHSMK